MPFPRVTLAVNGIRTTPLGFGCVGLFRISNPEERSDLLRTAYDSGLRHFDVAPMYGLGRAEHELGVFARMHRGELTIAAKFGIRPTLAARGMSHAQGPLRRLFAASPGFRDRAWAHAAAPSGRLYEHGGFHDAGARRSLERSQHPRVQRALVRVLGLGRPPKEYEQSFRSAMLSCIRPR
jgi:D-threo-aldose 1-dehydrogenase